MTRKLPSLLSLVALVARRYPSRRSPVIQIVNILEVEDEEGREKLRILAAAIDPEDLTCEDCGAVPVALHFDGFYEDGVGLLTEIFAANHGRE